MRKTHVTDKHAVDYVITNLNNAYSEENTTHTGALTVLYTQKNCLWLLRVTWKDVLKKRIFDIFFSWNIFQDLKSRF